ncbi:MAG: hypothetical protein J3Q66DRAFT_360702 [Benniella sp.]|nr:MAG: hypothetical protein J3Q66DRAFT_360702 [Benniella sp.]
MKGLVDDLKEIGVNFTDQVPPLEKAQGKKGFRPDFGITAKDTFVCIGEITGPKEASATWKRNWDLYKLVRFGKQILSSGQEIALLVQIVFDLGIYFRLTTPQRGVFLLWTVGDFKVPVCKMDIGSLLATLPVTEAMRNDLRRCVDAKRPVPLAWACADIPDAKKRLRTKH